MKIRLEVETNRLASLIKSMPQKEQEPEMLKLERMFQEAGMAEQLPTDNPEEFGANLMDSLRELDPLAVGHPLKAMFMYQTAEELAMDLIPTHHD